MNRREGILSRALLSLGEGDRDGAESILNSGRVTGARGERDTGVALLSEVLGLGDVVDVRSIPAGDGDFEVLRLLVLASRSIREGRAHDAAVHAGVAADMLSVDPGGAVYLRLRVASVFQAAFRFTGLSAHYRRGLSCVRPIADRIETPIIAVLARSILSTMHHVAGELHQSVAAADAAIELAAIRGISDHRFVALAHQFRGYALYEWNHLPEARAELERAWSLAGEEGRGVRSGVARVMAGLLQLEGDVVAADEWFGRLERIVSEPMTLRNREWLAAVRVRHGSANRRDLRVIDSWRQRYKYDLDGILELQADERPAKLGEFEHLVSVLESASQWEAILMIAPLMLEASEPARVWFSVRALTAKAVALDATGKRDEADESFRESLRRGQRGAFVRAFLDGAPRRVSLLRRATGDAEVGRWATGVLAAVGDGSVGASAELTPRQTEVLEAVALGLSNPGVAAALGVSESTVRTHLRVIFQTLGVASRTEAVAEARRSGLIE